MKTFKRFITSFAASALSAVMLLCSTSSAFAVENNTVAVADSNLPKWVDERFTPELKDSISKMDDNDTLFVVYDIDPLSFSYAIVDIDVYAESIGRGDEVIFSEEENIFYAPQDLIDQYNEAMYEQIMKNAIEMRSYLSDFCETLVCFDFVNFKIYLNANKLNIQQFSETITPNAGTFQAIKLDLADPDYYDAEHGLTWEDYSIIVEKSLKYYSERDNKDYYEWQFYPHITYDYVDGKCLALLASFTDNDSEFTSMRVDNKYVCFDREFGGAYLFYEDGEMKNPAQMYDEGKITLDEYYTLGAFLGDVNYDKRVDVNDVTYLQMHLAGYVHTYEENGEIFEYPYIDHENQSNVMVADINNDNKNDVTDVTNLQMMLAGYVLNF